MLATRRNDPMPGYDVIVVGAGVVGASTLWRLARRGLRALAIDQHRPPHGLGSSHGQSRIIRQAYFEHPDYVPLARLAYRGWEQLEEQSGERLFERVGLVQVGPPDGVVVPGVLRAAAEHGIAVDSFEAADLEARWPQFRVPQGMACVHEPTAGLLHVERCVQAALDCAEALGAETALDTRVLRWSAGPHGVTVDTNQGALSCDRLVLAAGPWAPELLGPLGVAMHVRRKSMFWFQSPAAAGLGQMPPYLFEMAGGVFYGCPALDDRGLKVGDHAGGKPVKDPAAVDREIDPEEEAAVRGFLASCLPVATDRRTDHSVCLYTMSPDEHFLVDSWPGEPRIVFAAGLSGHGFKFAPALGDALADLATQGTTESPVGFLGIDRFR